MNEFTRNLKVSLFSKKNLSFKSLTKAFFHCLFPHQFQITVNNSILTASISHFDYKTITEKPTHYINFLFFFLLFMAQQKYLCNPIKNSEFMI